MPESEHININLIESADIKAALPGNENSIKNEKQFLLIRTALRLEIISLISLFIIYLVLGALTWTFNQQGAERLIQLTNSLVGQNDYKDVNELKMDDLNRKLNVLLASQKYKQFPVSTFFQYGEGTHPIPTAGNSGTIGFKRDTLFTPNPKQTDSLAEITSYSRASISQKIQRIVNGPLSSIQVDNYNRYRLDQFLERGSYIDAGKLPIIILLFTLLLITILTYSYYYYLVITHDDDYKKKQRALHDVAQQSQEALLVWDLAQKKLNKYYDRNLNQNNSIFIVSVVVMIAGFALVLYGISLYFQSPKDNEFVTGISAVAGTIVQFIGATFLVIYNSTIKQAIQYTNSLQQVSMIGTSIKILDNIRNDKQDEGFAQKEEKIMLARIDIAKMLINPLKNDGGGGAAEQ